MDIAQQKPAMSPDSRPDAPHPEPHRFPRTDSFVSTYSASTPGTSQGKASMEVEQNAPPFPNGFTQLATHNVFPTPPKRRMATIPFASPSQLAIVEPVSSSFPESYDSHASIAGQWMGPPAQAIAARAVVADSPPQPPPKPQRSVTLSPSPASFSGHPAAYTTPQLPVLSLQGRDSGAESPPIDRRMSHPACLIPGPSSYRPAISHMSLMPPFPSKFSIEGVSARLSPAIITRQPQHPILALPPISSTPSPVIDTRRLRSRSLRSVPALPMEGSEDLEPAEHDNAMLDDFDEEEEGMVDEDSEVGEEAAEPEHPDTTSEDGESIFSPSSPLVLQTSHPSDLPSIDVTPLDLSFLGGDTSGNLRRDDKTPKDSQMTDYFTSTLPEPASSRTPLLSSRQFPAAWTPARTSPVLPAATPSSVRAAAWATPAPRAMPTPTTPTVNARASMYHQASCSMVDMSEILRKEQRTPDLLTKTPKSPIRSPALEADTVAAAVAVDEPAQLGPSLRRRLSMPTFGPSSAPPPYPQFYYGDRGPAIQPRDDEGRERLPRYTNDIYLRAIMPRKMEFSAPGVQARDRKWRRILCVLEGTAFRVYKCPSAATGKGLIGNLWEKTVGVGDIATSSTQVSATAPDANKERERDARLAKLERADGTPVPPPASPTPPSPALSPQTEAEQEAQSSSLTHRPRLLPPNLRRRDRTGSDGPSVSRPGSGTRRSFASLQQPAADFSSGHDWSLPGSGSSPISRTTTTSPGLGMPRSGSSRTPRVKRRHLWVDDPSVPRPQPQDLLYAYSLHNAESGLGSDYVKRRNVIRIRMEGQQFLLQARDVSSVVDWIEGFQAAANIAQDLDVRPMPKGPLFPRRRRRRHRAGGQVVPPATAS
ncbi:hypothetical protein BJV78DRAFT_1154970 [Lactifluus subvellereus]|nr:hypothetical protein BJV78DRAFT_1154970 [Lactifluus subvellereus]